MAKRKATRRTQRKARGRGHHMPPTGTAPLYPPMAVEPQRPGVLITLGDGTTLFYVPPKSEGPA